jgi:hypothetical protein
MSTLWLPPPEFAFRVVGLASKAALYSRFGPEPVFHHSAGWHLIRSKGHRPRHVLAQ